MDDPPATPPTSPPPPPSMQPASPQPQPPPQPASVASEAPIYQKESFWAMCTHLSVLTGCFSFVGFFLGPLVIWILKKDEFPSIDAHFKDAINFQLSIILYLIIAGALILLTLGLGAIILIPALFVLGIIDILFPILAAIQAGGDKAFRYPLSIRFVR